MICLFFPPILSDDIFYYIWQGKVAAHGFNPYLFNPQSPELSFLHDSKIWEPIPFKDIAPAYPPFVMMTFFIAYKIGGSSLIGFKLLQWIPEIITCFFGVKLLELHKKNPCWILIYAWCPLPIIEYMGMGHSDVWGIAFLIGFLYFFKKEKIPLAFVFLAMATLVKWIPLLFIPLLWRYINWKKRGISLLAFSLTCALIYLPFLSAGKNVLGLLPTYLKSWEFNGFIYKFIRQGLERADVTHMLVSGIIALFSLGIAYKKPPLIQGLLAITFSFFLFFHTIYPWYLGWFLPFLLLENCWAAYVWIFTSFFSYWILISYRMQGIWKENPWILTLEYLPVFFLLIVQAIYSQKKST